MKSRIVGVVFGLLVALSLNGCIVVAEDPNRGATGSSSSGDNMTASLTVVNNASQSVHYIYFSAATTSSWEDDMLPPDQTLNPGESVTIRCTPGVWDVKCVMAEGPPVIHYNVNLDGAYTLTLTDK